ncbi:uncharacterized protein LOC62_07G008957 [Vanrija pseudolonga]|uniref:Uncharacterized protein n=1 Tax=Vanrija pseudolonga TaxID=143232 RepID=A0AAF0YEX7_9TREE|nr:hypothetical protein LOC62_07G008957 [Vanrija pseudolonga]
MTEVLYTGPVIDYRGLPHVFDEIMDSMPWEALPALRLTNKEVSERANALLWRHIVVRVEWPGHIDMLDPFHHRRIPGLRFECASQTGTVPDAHDELLLYRTLDRLRLHTRTVDHWLHPDEEPYATHPKPPRWHGNVCEALASALHRVDVSANELPFLAQEAERVVLRYRPASAPSEVDQRPYRGAWPVGFGSKRVVARLDLPVDLQLTPDDWVMLWAGVLPCREYLPPACDDVVVVITQGRGHPPHFSRFTPPAGDRVPPYFDLFLSILRNIGAKGVAVVGLESVDPGVFGFQVDPAMQAEGRLALFKTAIDKWISESSVEVVTAERYRRTRDLDLYRWGLLAAAPGQRLPPPSTWVGDW